MGYYLFSNHQFVQVRPVLLTQFARVPKSTQSHSGYSSTHQILSDKRKAHLFLIDYHVFFASHCYSRSWSRRPDAGFSPPAQ